MISTKSDTIIQMRQKAFSLIELLVVLSIVALLMTITLTAMKTVREQTRAILCQSRQKQLMLSFQEYTQTHNKFPPGSGFKYINNQESEGISPPGGLAGGNMDPADWWWFHYLGYKSPNWIHPQPLLECPSKFLPSELQENVLWGNYGVNWSVCRTGKEATSYYNTWKKPLHVDKVRRPSETMLLSDSGYAVVSWNHTTLNPPEITRPQSPLWNSYIPGLSINKDPRKPLYDVQHDDAIKGRHPSKTINVIYTDGHLARINAEQTLVDNPGEDYTNIPNFWLPNPLKFIRYKASMGYLMTPSE